MSSEVKFRAQYFLLIENEGVGFVEFTANRLTRRDCWLLHAANGSGKREHWFRTTSILQKFRFLDEI